MSPSTLLQFRPTRTFNGFEEHTGALLLIGVSQGDVTDPEAGLLVRVWSFLDRRTRGGSKWAATKCIHISI
jgi:hypothetical protein